MRLVIPYFPSSSLILSFQAEFLFPVRRYGRTKGTDFLLTHRDREICQSEKSAVFLHKTHYRTPDTSESGSKIGQNPSNVTSAQDSLPSIPFTSESVLTVLTASG